MKNTVTFQTSGRGFWSGSKKGVPITDMTLGFISDEFDNENIPDYGELRVYFNTAKWNTNEDGLIYTDQKFMKELRDFLKTHHLAGTVHYTEQGMQGDNYVSCGVDRAFLKSWGEKFDVDWTAFFKKQQQRFYRKMSRLRRRHR